MIHVDIKMALSLRPDVPEYKVGTPVRWKQTKGDGYRCAFVNDKDDCFFAIGRKEDYSAMLVDHPTLWKTICEMPANTVLDGELYVDGGKSSDVVTALLAKDPRLVYAPFAAPVLKGVDLQAMDLSVVLEEIRGYGWTTLGNEILVSGESVSLTEGLVLEMLKDASARKIEGFVLKNQHNAEWYKLKPQKTVDVVVMAWDSGVARNYGKMGALICGLYDESGKLVEIANVGGGYTDEMRRTFKPENTEGRVIEVTYQSVAAKGRLQFPRFERFRDDKPAEDCKLSQIGR